MNAAAPLRALLLVTLAVTSLRAQEGTRPLELLVAPETGELTVRLGDLLEDPSLRNALLSGLPLRIRIVAELWRDGLFDSESGRATWLTSSMRKYIGTSTSLKAMSATLFAKS